MYILKILYSSYDSELISTKLRLHFHSKCVRNILHGVFVPVKPTPTLPLLENWTGFSSSNFVQRFPIKFK